MLGLFPGSRMAIAGRHRAPNQPKMAINGPFGAISRPSGSKLVGQGRINLGHIHGNVLGQFPGSGMANGGRHMVQKAFRHFYGRLAFLGFFWTMMAIPDPEKGSNTSPRMCPD